MKRILLVPDEPHFYYVDIAVNDFPEGEGGAPRWRCKITAEFSKFDVEQLTKQGMDFDQVMEYYRKWLDTAVKVRILDEWDDPVGIPQVMEIIRNRVQTFFI